MKMDQLYQRVKQGLNKNELVLDVRDADEYAEGHVQGSRNIPHDVVAEHAGELKGYEKIYVHCGGGGRAGRAVEALEKAGLGNLVHIAESGMRSWVQAGWPTEK